MTKVEPAADPGQPDHGEAEAPGPLVEQAGAICLRGSAWHGDLEVLLIASRNSGGWGIPKGHIEAGETSHHAARREAFEEAGILGDAAEPALGSFFHDKRGRGARYRVTVHLLQVRSSLPQFPEQGTRKTKWVPLAIASQEVANRDLARILDAAFHQAMTDTYNPMRTFPVGTSFPYQGPA